MEAFMDAIKRIIHRYINDAQHNERYHTKWPSSTSVKTSGLAKPRLSALDSERLASDAGNAYISEVLASDMRSSDMHSSQLLSTRGPFGAPGSGQPRDGFRPDGRRILARPQDLAPRSPHLDPTKPTSPVSEKVCFRFAKGQCTDVNCAYSHDLQLALAHLQSEFSKVRPRVHILDGATASDDVDSSATSESSHED
jgi:hypothetical protein